MNIYIAAFMRTGSSHLTYSLARALNYRVTVPQIGFAGKAGTDEHIVNYAVLAVQHLEGNFVYHQHAKGTGNNVAILGAYGFTPIVMMRNMYDCLVSCFDQMPASEHMTIPGSKRPPWGDMSTEQQWKWVAYNMIPWYYSFYTSWMKADVKHKTVWYVDHYKDQIKSMKSIMKFVKLPEDEWPSDEKLEKACRVHDNSRLHVGTTGRGEGVPSYVKKIAEDHADQWGPWGKQMKKDLLKR